MPKFWKREVQRENENKIEDCIYQIGTQAYNILLPEEQKSSSSESGTKEIKIGSPARIRPENGSPSKQKKNRRVVFKSDKESAELLSSKIKTTPRRINSVR